LILGQVCLRGLRPALAEGRRLAREEPAVRARHANAQERFESMEQQVRAWRDPVYWERLRRQRARDQGELEFGERSSVRPADPPSLPSVPRSSF